MQDGVVKNGYALIIHNAWYAGEEHGSHINSLVVSEFLERCGFKSALYNNHTAEVMSYCYLTTDSIFTHVLVTLRISCPSNKLKVIFCKLVGHSSGSCEAVMKMVAAYDLLNTSLLSPPLSPPLTCRAVFFMPVSVEPKCSASDIQGFCQTESRNRN